MAFFRNKAEMDFSETKEASNKEIVSSDYISQLKKTIETSYPVTAYAWQDPAYPEKDVEWAYVKNAKKSDIYKRYNPFGLRLPYELEGYERLYEHTRISYNKDTFPGGYSLGRTEASITYFNFLKQYNLAYITFLQAINGSAEAIKSMIELVTTKKMFTDAKVKLNYLSDTTKNPSFLLGVLAYLVLNIVYSQDKNISTLARIKALEFVKDNFEIAAVAKAFYDFNLGYKLPYRAEEEAAFDLIPRKFVSSAEESGGTPQNDLFLKNKKIKEIFPPRRVGYNAEMDLDRGVSTLITQYPHEAVQVLHSLLRVDGLFGHPVEFIFAALISLTKLDSVQRGEIFGERASFRNNGESSRGLDARLGWVIGSESFGDYVSEDELNHLSVDELKQRVRQYALRIHQLEYDAVEATRESVMREINSNNDPKGYFKILLLRPDTAEEHFEEILKRNYRSLAMKYHPDKTKIPEDSAKFPLLQEAYSFLLDPKNRESYRQLGTKKSNLAFV